MSMYRMFVAAVAALSLTTVVFAADEAAMTATSEPQEIAADATQNAVQQDKVNVNTATAKELAKVKGLNTAKAKAIVSYRKKHGEFKSLDDLKEVKGMKKTKPEQMKMIQDQLTVG